MIKKLILKNLVNKNTIKNLTNENNKNRIQNAFSILKENTFFNDEPLINTLDEYKDNELLSAIKKDDEEDETNKDLEKNK